MGMHVDRNDFNSGAKNKTCQGTSEGDCNMKFKNKHRGPSLESFLEEEGILEEATVAAVKSVIAWQLAEEMRKKKSPRNAWPK